jgi:hypothetical protein
MSVLRWLVVATAVLVLVGLLAFARGTEHQRGDETGALPRASGAGFPASGASDGT